MTSIERNIMRNEEKINKRIATLKARETKLLNKTPKTQKEFEIIQEELNRIKIELKSKGE